MPPRKRNAGDASGASAKKTRFVEPADDPVNFAEQVDAELENTSHRKNRVRTEGYDSDSSDDGEGVVLSRKKAAAEDEDEDMFAIAEKEEKSEAADGKKKKEEYLRLGDIEGQEFAQDGSDNDSLDDDEPEDEDDAIRRKKAGMGYELSSFNMREEMEEGKFTEDGSYVRSTDPNLVHDRWMDGLDEKEIQQARRRKKEQDRIQKKKMLEEERTLQESGGKPALEKQLIPYLKKGETVLEALQRLGRKPKKRSQAMDTDKSTKSQSDVEEITHLATSIMSLGESDVYSMAYEELVRSVRSSGIVEPSWEPPSADKKYEYKWAATGPDILTDTFGPFNEEEMKAWFNAAYFGSMGEKIQVREVGGEWSHWDDVIV